MSGGDVPGKGIVAFVGLLGVVSAGCMSLPVYTPPVPPTLAEWRAALAGLRALRAQAVGGGSAPREAGSKENTNGDGTGAAGAREAGSEKNTDSDGTGAAGPREAAAGDARTLKLSLALREPVSGRRMEARGAVALSPGRRAVRMILVGPGGTTAFDLWIEGDRFRVSIPAVDLLRRGDAATPKAEMRGLPVDFLRWWLLDPTRGELLWADRGPRGARWILREGGAITELVARADGGFAAERRTWSRPPGDAKAAPVLLDEEKVTADRLGCGRARYTQASTGVEIEITCEGVEPNPPSDRAFIDPDALDEGGDP